jgi:hypothetical protein
MLSSCPCRSIAPTAIYHRTTWIATLPSTLIISFHVISKVNAKIPLLLVATVNQINYLNSMPSRQQKIQITSPLLPSPQQRKETNMMNPPTRFFLIRSTDTLNHSNQKTNKRMQETTNQCKTTPEHPNISPSVVPAISEMVNIPVVEELSSSPYHPYTPDIQQHTDQEVVPDNPCQISAPDILVGESTHHKV